jgi:hypothetical protein
MEKYSIINLVLLLPVAVGWYYYHTPHKPGTPTTQSAHVIQQAATNSEISLSPIAICKAFDKAIEFLNISSDQIMPVNNQQKAFLNADYATYRKYLKPDLFAPDELKAYVARDAQTLNKILRDNGFSIQLQEFVNAQSIGIVAIQDILLKWLKAAKRITIPSGKKQYIGFHLDEHRMDVSFSGNDVNKPTIVVAKISTQSHDKVYCAVRMNMNSDKVVLVPFFEGVAAGLTDHEVMHAVCEIREKLKDSSQYSNINRYNAIELPMIEYQAKPSVKWLIGLKFSPGYEVAQALQEVIFKMNEFGARAKAAVAIELMKSVAPSPNSKVSLVVNQPFLLWIERPGMPLPIFAAYLPQKYWADPGSLEG